jgi:hypothetical protein
LAVPWHHGGLPVTCKQRVERLPDDVRFRHAEGLGAPLERALVPLFQVELLSHHTYITYVAAQEGQAVLVLETPATIKMRGAGNAAAREKARFAVKPAAVSGTVHLSTKAVAVRASYDSEGSGDGGKTWTAASPALKAKIGSAGLPVATVAQVRFRAITAAGAGDWSRPISLRVK